MLALDRGELHLELVLLEALWYKLAEKFDALLVHGQAFQGLVVNLAGFPGLSMLDALLALVHAEVRYSFIGHPKFVGFLHVLGDLGQSAEELHLLLRRHFVHRGELRCLAALVSPERLHQQRGLLLIVRIQRGDLLLLLSVRRSQCFSDNQYQQQKVHIELNYTYQIHTT
jgi:hypothetical protein